MTVSMFLRVCVCERSTGSKAEEQNDMGKHREKVRRRSCWSWTRSESKLKKRSQEKCWWSKSGKGITPEGAVREERAPWKFKIFVLDKKTRCTAIKSWATRV